MHRIAIGDPQCVCHELFAQLRIRMVDGVSVWQQFYPHASGSLGSSGCGYRRCLVEVWNCVHVDISSGTHRKRARFGNAQAIIRCGEPVQLQLWVRIFCLQSRRGTRCRTGPWAFYKWRDNEIVSLICPTCQNVFAESLKASMPATTMLLCMGLFSIF